MFLLGIKTTYYLILLKRVLLEVRMLITLALEISFIGRRFFNPIAPSAQTYSDVLAEPGFARPSAPLKDLGWALILRGFYKYRHFPHSVGKVFFRTKIFYTQIHFGQR